MKKLLLAAFFLVSMAVCAQEITQKSLQGKWSLVLIEAEGITINFEQKKFTITPEFKQDNDEEYVKSIEDDLKQMIDTSITMYFMDNSITFSRVANGETNGQEGTFEIEKDRSTLLTITFTESGTEMSYEATFIDSKLVLYDLMGQGAMTLKKVQ